jgi:chromosomal replication initiation ATPase DnaA
MKISDIIREVCEKRGISKKELLSKRRYRYLALARREISQRAYRWDYSLEQIGRAINRDHTTVLHHLRVGGLSPTLDM